MNKKENLLSIIVPIYGTEKYLPKCLDSLVSQSYENIEIICVDDCSPGEAEKICKKYMKEFDCIKYIKNKVNLGLFKSRLVGSDIAKGDYICFVDSDDYVSIDGYRNLLLVAEENSTEIISGTTIMNDENIKENIFIQEMALDWKLEKKIQKKFFEQQGLNTAGIQYGIKYIIKNYGIDLDLILTT